jgi:hypothetical protein
VATIQVPYDHGKIWRRALVGSLSSPYSAVYTARAGRSVTLRSRP